MERKVVDDFLKGKIAFFNASTGEHYQGRDDLLLVLFTERARVGLLTTQSSIVAAPVEWCRQRHRSGSGARALLVNAGNANCYTGEKGRENVRIMAYEAAKKSQCSPEETWVCSTGVIGEQLHMERLLKGIEEATPCSVLQAARTILTTDTHPKIAHRPSMLAFSKGVGMIAPKMATMLCFVFINGGFPEEELQRSLKNATDKTLNRVHIDGDTSTNDTVILFDVGDIKNPSIKPDDLEPMLTELLADLALQHVRDGEGSKRILHLEIQQAQSQEEAQKVFHAVCGSLLVKTALTGGDANWGRLIAAVGKSQVPIDERTFKIFIGKQQVIQNGARHPDYNEKEAQSHFSQPIVEITMALGRGKEGYQGWGCDLTKNYIAINANYRT